MFQLKNFTLVILQHGEVPANFFKQWIMLGYLGLQSVLEEVVFFKLGIVLSYFALHTLFQVV